MGREIAVAKGTTPEPDSWAKLVKKWKSGREGMENAEMLL